jgi:hypothetical protein
LGKQHVIVDADASRGAPGRTHIAGGFQLEPVGGRNISKKWTMPIRDWKAALNRFTIQFEERLPQR